MAQGRGLLNGIGSAFKLAHYQLIQAIGIDATFQSQQSGGEHGDLRSIACRVGMRTTRSEDEPIINTYGYESVTFTMNRQDLVNRNPGETEYTITPEVLDEMWIWDNNVPEDSPGSHHRKIFTITGINHIHAPNGELIGYLIIAKGA